MSFLGKVMSKMDAGMQDKIIGAAFSHFDKDKSGFLEGHEVYAVVEHTVAKLGLPIGRSQVEMVFKKVAGPDQKLDKAEFTRLMGHLIKTHGSGAPAHH